MLPGCSVFSSSAGKIPFLEDLEEFEVIEVISQAVENPPYHFNTFLTPGLIQTLRLKNEIENPTKELCVTWWTEMSFCEIAENREFPYQPGSSHEFSGVVIYSSAYMAVLLLG